MARKNQKEKFDKMNENLRDSAFKAQCLSGLMMPLMTFIGNLGYVAVCIVGALLVMNDKISFGVIIAFMMYVRYFTQATQSDRTGDAGTAVCGCCR